MRIMLIFPACLILTIGLVAIESPAAAGIFCCFKRDRCNDCNECREYEDDDDDRKDRGCCFCPPAPPRAEVGFSLPGRFNIQSRPGPTIESQQKKLQTKVDDVERDLTRLTLVVEKLADSHKDNQRDLTRLGVVVEKLVGAQEDSQRDLARLSVLIERLAKDKKDGR